MQAHQSTCSASGINRSCDVYIDRLRPVAPPTLYLRRGDVVTVHVINSSPFETLSIDFKNAGDTSAPDPFSSLMSADSATITKLVIPDEVNFVAYDVPGPQPVDPFTAERDELKHVAATQRTLFSEYDPSVVMKEILLATQSPPANACTAALAWDEMGYPNPWLSPGTWATAVAQVLNTLQAGVPAPATLAPQVTQLDLQVAALVAYQPPSQLPSSDASLLKAWKTAVDNVNDRQKVLDDWKANPPKALPPASAVIDQALIAAIKNFNLKNSTPIERTRKIIDLYPADLNVTTETWSLDYINNFQTAVKNALTATLVSNVVTTTATASTILSSPPSTTAIASLNVTYERPQRLEFATGVMTPVLSYHSYSAAEAAAGGTVTGTVIQETKSYTVLPMAMTNIVLKQGIANGKPLAGFFTIGVGYNPVTSSIEFGVGPSFSYRSVIVSVLGDIGQDTHLTDGFTVGQSLPSTNTKPLTSNSWFFRPAFGLSVRIPLGGGQSSSSSNSGSGSGGGGGASGGGKQ